MTDVFDGAAHLAPVDDLLQFLSIAFPVQAAKLSMLMTLEKDQATKGWDLPPRLISLHAEWIDDAHYSLAASDLGELPDVATEQGGTSLAAFLTHGSQNMTDFGDAAWRKTVDAIVLAHEGYVGPEQIEVRTMLCIDRDGATYTLLRWREEDVLLAGVEMDAPESDDGQVVEAVRKLVDAL